MQIVVLCYKQHGNTKESSSCFQYLKECNSFPSLCAVGIVGPQVFCLMPDEMSVDS